MLRPVTPLAALLLLASTAHAQTPEWPGWRGPTGDGHAAPDARPPLDWSEDANVRWKVELPGLGNSSPVVVGDRIYLTAAVDTAALEPDAPVPPQPGPPTADAPHRFLVLAVDRADGSVAWQTVVHEETPHEKGHDTGSHASASIHTDGERLVAFFGSRGLYVLDLDGEVQWSKDLGQMVTLAKFGEGSTPVLHDGTVVVQWDEEGPSFVAAFDAATGEERWRQARETDSSWGSPVVAEVDGAAQVIVTGSDATRAYDLESGDPVWSCGGMSKNPVNTAVVADGVAYVMNSYKGNVVQAIRLADAHGEVQPDGALLWSRQGNAAYVPIPVVHDGLLYYTRNSNGILTCADALTGEPRYSGARLEGIRRIHASPVVAGGRLYFVSREGLAVVVKPGPEFEVLAENQLDDVFDATPAFVGDELYLRGRRNLYCLAEAD